MPSKPQLFYYATDKDLFDALVSARQQFNEAALRNLARTRGIYYSDKDDRVTLAENISLMTFGFLELSDIQAEFERSGKGEKTASFRMKTALSLEEIKKIIGEFHKAIEQDGEKVTSGLLGETGLEVNVKYNDLDLSKTRLRQVQKKEARIELKVIDGETVVSYPSNEKAAALAKSLAKRVNSVKEAVIAVEEIDFSSMNKAGVKTAFFTRLISSVGNFNLTDVTTVKVDTLREQKKLADSEDDSDADSGEGAEKEAADEKMLGVVRSVALSGESLLSSPEYQSLQKRGFFISKIHWSSKRASSPYQIVDFEASFGDPFVGTGYSYKVRGWYTQKDGKYIQNPTKPPVDDLRSLMELLERTSMTVFKSLQAEAAPSSKQEYPQVSTPPEVGVGEKK